jgi:hypothetical protein
MPDNIHIKLPDGNDKEMPKGATVLDAAKPISPRLEKISQTDQIRQAGFSGKKTIRRVE